MIQDIEPSTTGPMAATGDYDPTIPTFDPHTTQRRLADHEVRIERLESLLAEPTCRVCGCTEDNACQDDDAGPCWWIEPGLCSHCAGKEGA